MATMTNPDPVYHFEHSNFTHPRGAVLCDTAIREAIDRGQITVQPLRPGAIGSNSIDVHLGRNLLVYTSVDVDPARDNPVREIEIPPEGLLLEAGRLYLGVTQEYTESNNLIPWLDGRSSVGRLGLSVHVTAGRGDIGFTGHWTLEITAMASPAPWWRRLSNRRVPWWRRPFHPGGVVVYPGMPIGQLTFFTVEGVVTTPYTKKVGAKYAELGASADPRPRASKMWKHFEQARGPRAA